MDEKQNYFNIGKLTEEFRKEVTDMPEEKAKEVNVAIFYTMALLAQAQQLSVIASTLKRLEKVFTQVPEPDPRRTVVVCPDCGGPVDADGYCDPCAKKANGDEGDWEDSSDY